MSEKRTEVQPEELRNLYVNSFKQRFPWIGGDLQTLRDSFISEKFPPENSRSIKIPIPSLPNGNYKNGNLLALLDEPNESQKILGLIIILHGLGGSSRRQGLRRLGLTLKRAGFAVLRLNLRGAIPGRHLAGGTYAANCNTDLFPVLLEARKLSYQLSISRKPETTPIPLFGVGISLGGTILLNACLEKKLSKELPLPLLDGLICTSSPLDLTSCSASIERPRNKIYQQWLLNRLMYQTLNDPFGVSFSESEFLKQNSIGLRSPLSIRSFDNNITAPRWGYKNVDDYYSKASPLTRLLGNPDHLPETLILQSKDDPWVPSQGAERIKTQIANSNSKIKVILTKYGGHNGFHGINNCWADYLVRNWLIKKITN